MRALVVEQLGDPTLPLGSGVLAIRDDQPAPRMLAGHVRVRVRAASVNFPDALQVQGLYQSRPPLPFVPGSEVSGVVTEVADDVVAASGSGGSGGGDSGGGGLRVGDVVVAITQGGAFSEEVVVPALATWKVPAGVDPAAAAALPVVYGTADLALRHRARLRRGETLLVLGASGGVGSAAVQIGRLLGATVVAVTRGEAKARYCRDVLKADVVIDTAALEQQQQQRQQPGQKGGGGGKKAAAASSNDGLKAALAAAGVGRGATAGLVDVVFDPVGGGAALREALRAAAFGCRYLVIGFASGDIPKVPVNLLLVKNVTMHGVFWGAHLAHRPRVLLESMRQVMAWAAEGKIAPHVSAALPLARAPEAFAMMLQRRVMGKVLLTMGGGEDGDDEAGGGGGAPPRSRL